MLAASANAEPGSVSFRESCAKRFKDPSRPLVVDFGCGLGVSLLGLASIGREEAKTNSKDSPESYLGKLIDFSSCNFMGADLNPATIRYGSGIAKRLNLTDTLQFLHLSSDALLDQITHDYPGRIALLLIQFPTPYRLSTGNETGNMQLPSGPDDPSFMVSGRIMQRIAELLRRSGGYLLLQTNCEDVAVTLRDRAQNTGLDCCASEQSRGANSRRRPSEVRLPERTMEWIRLGGRRAIGEEWFADPLLPNRCATETEIACELQGTPVHRCLMRRNR